MTTPAATTDQPSEQPTRRHRSRRNVLASSVHRDDYVTLMRAGWSSKAIERYAAYRFGEDIPASTVRAYRSRKKIAATALPAFPGLKDGASTDPEKALDVMGLRSEAIQLQQARIRLEVAAEVAAGRLNPVLRDEIRLYNLLLNDHKADQQDWALMPKAGDKVDVQVAMPGVQAVAGQVPRYDTLGDLFGVEPGSEGERELAKVMHLADRQRASA